MRAGSLPGKPDLGGQHGAPTVFALVSADMDRGWHGPRFEICSVVFLMMKTNKDYFPKPGRFSRMRREKSGERSAARAAAVMTARW